MWQGEIWSELKWTGIGEHASLTDINIIHSIISISLFLNGSNPLADSSWQVSIDQINLEDICNISKMRSNWQSIERSCYITLPW